MNRYKSPMGINLDCKPSDIPQEPKVVWTEPHRPNHVTGCACEICWQAGLAYGEYLHKKAMQDWWEGA